MRVLVCGVEIANNIFTFTDVLRKSGMDAESLCFIKSVYYPDNIYDHGIWAPPGMQRKHGLDFFLFFGKVIAFMRLCARFDVFLYVWSHSFLPFKLDMLLLRLLGKRVIVFNCGDDVRYRPIQSRIDREHFNLRYYADNDSAYLKKHDAGGNWFIRGFYHQRLEEIMGATIVSFRSQATFQSRPAYFYRFPQPAICSEPRRTNDIPLIIHAPTDRVAKGTYYVLEAIEQLRVQGVEFEFELIENQSNDYLLERVSKADIVIDQPGPWFGKFGAEALAAGCVLFSGNRADYYGFMDENSPVIQFNPDASALYEQLVKVVTDVQFRQGLMIASHEYWKKRYSDEAFIRYFEKICIGTAERFNPLHQHRELLLEYARTWWQRLLIRCFYPRNVNA